MGELRIGGWIIGYYCPVSHLREFENEHMIIDVEYPQGVSYVVDPETLGECTGLSDKNGTFIFEGDILKIVGSNAPNCFVEFREGIFYVKSQMLVYKTLWDFLKDYKVEIVGNVYDNPELLKN